MRPLDALSGKYPEETDDAEFIAALEKEIDEPVLRIVQGAYATATATHPPR